QEVLQMVTHQLQFFPQIDIFATRTTKRCNRYCSLLKDRGAEGRRGAFSINWSNEALLLHPPIELIPRILKKMKLEPSTALFLLPDWCLMKFKLLFPRIIQILNLGPTETVLEKGKSLESHQLKLPPGDQLAVLTTSMQLENNYLETLPPQLDWYLYLSNR
ncbi:MAG: hypothetical protein EZS28_047933, partial [Streblomastix strix]